MFCKNCGTEIPEGQSFCTNCGMEAGSAEPVVAPVIEPEIDTSNQETMVFTPVEEPVQPDLQQTQQFQPPVPPVQQTQQYQGQQFQGQQYQPQQQYPYQQPVYGQQYEQQTYAPPAPAATTAARVSSGSSEGKSRTVIIVVIAIVLLAIIGVVIAAVVVLGGGEESSSSGSKNRGGIVSDTDPGDTTDSGITPISESNLYYEYYVDADSYVLSATDSRYYSRSELAGMTRQQLYLAEREIFARYGCTFDDGDLSNYFGAKNWYSPDSPVGNFNESRLNATERVNLLLLRAMLMERDGTNSNNEYLKVNNDVEGWILNSTDNTRITKEDVQGLSEKELIIAYNEIYARRGYIFEDDALQLYFSSKNWYVPAVSAGSFDASQLSEIEQENYTCLQACAKKAAGVKFSSGNKYYDYYYSYVEYQCVGSDQYAISPYDLKYMTAEQLTLARNEIYARYGYSYSNNELNEYFMNCSWYYPTVVNTKLELIHLSKQELANVKMIQAFELDLKLAEGKGNPNTKMSYYAKHDFLTMYLPAHWQDNCICVKPDGTSGNMYFYEKYNQEQGDGWLYSIEFVPVDSGIPSYYGCYAELYGTVTTPDGSQYYVMKVMPNYTDASFLFNVYNLMQSQIGTIWESIEWKSGYSFTPA